MHPTFQNWALARVEKELTDPVTKQKFLRKLKLEPSVVKDILAENCYSWGQLCAIETGKTVIQDFQDDPGDLLQALQEHFAKELAEIPEAPATVPQ